MLYSIRIKDDVEVFRKSGIACCRSEVGCRRGPAEGVKLSGVAKTRTENGVGSGESRKSAEGAMRRSKDLCGISQAKGQSSLTGHRLMLWSGLHCGRTGAAGPQEPSGKGTEETVWCKVVYGAAFAFMANAAFLWGKAISCVTKEKGDLSWKFLTTL